MKRILITNDDGIAAAGLLALDRALTALAQVYTVAPREERSAASHSISLRGALSYERLEERRWAVDGTPADAVILALHHLLDFRPDLLISGINHGGNLGKNVHYSGTVGAAAEAVLNGIPGVAVSLCGRAYPTSAAASRRAGTPGAGAGPDFAPAAVFAAELAARVLDRGLPEGVLLNVNVPRRWTNGVRTTRAYRYLARTGLVEKDGLWIREQVDFDNAPPDSDYVAIRAGSVSVTPLAIFPAEEAPDWKWESWSVQRG